MAKTRLILTAEEGLKDHEKWLALRNTGIGGSDASVIMGYNPYKSRLTLWMEKTGKMKEPDLSDNERVYWGVKNEANISDYFCEKTGKTVRRCGMMQSVEHPWLLANVDRLIVGEDSGLEIKTAGVSQYERWKDDEVPDEYYCQCQHYMMVTGKSSWWICVLIGGNEGRIKEIPRNDSFIEELFHKEAAFWTLVEHDIMPEVDGSEDASKSLAAMYDSPETGSEMEVELTDKLEEIFKDYAEYKKTIETMEELKKECENKIKALMGENEVLKTGNHKVTWKMTKGRVTIDTKALEKDLPEVYEKYKKVGDPTRSYFRMK